MKTIALAGVLLAVALVPVLRSWLPATTPRLQEIIMRALARDVRERYQSLDDMRHDLAGMVRATPTHVGLRVDPAVVRPPAAPPRVAEAERATLCQALMCSSQFLYVD